MAATVSKLVSNGLVVAATERGLQLSPEHKEAVKFASKTDAEAFARCLVFQFPQFAEQALVAEAV